MGEHKSKVMRTCPKSRPVSVSWHARARRVARTRLGVAMVTACVIGLCGATAPAQAHEVGLSTGRYAVSGAEVAATVSFARLDALRLVPELDANRDRRISAEEVAARPNLADAIADPITISSDGKPCSRTKAKVALVEEDGLELEAAFRCPDPSGPRRVSVEAGFLRQLRSGHRHVAAIEGGGKRVTPVLLVDAPRGELLIEGGPADGATEAPVATRGVAFFTLGVEHIWGGLDHLAFLAALVLVPLGAARSKAGLRALGPVLAVVTAFTLAHSVSLALAALGVWTPSPRWVEPLIAASVAAVALENLRAAEPRRRWLTAGLFGFVHGFGFAGVLVERGLARAEAAPALLAFNLGVEAGQLAVLAVALPILARLRSHPRTASAFARGGKATRATSVALAALGVLWLVERLASG